MFNGSWNSCPANNFRTDVSPGKTKLKKTRNKKFKQTKKNDKQSQLKVNEKISNT